MRERRKEGEERIEVRRIREKVAGGRGRRKGEEERGEGMLEDR